MKKIFLLTLLASATAAFAYQTGSVSRPNFTPSTKTEDADKDKQSVPGQQGVQTRSFTSYGSRQGAWRKGVQTQTVQTQKASQVAVKAKDPGNPDEQKAATAAKAVAAQVQNASAKATSNAPAAKKNDKAQPPAQAGAPDMSALANMMGGAGGAGGGMPDMSALTNMMGAAAGGAQPGGAGGGMPDMSALMNMMGGAGGAGNAGAKK